MIPVEHWNSVPYNKNSHCCRYIECAIKIRMWMLFLSFFVPFGIGNFSPTMEALTQCQLRCERIFANIRILVPSFDNVSTNFYSTISARRLTSWTNVQFYGNNTSFPTTIYGHKDMQLSIAIYIYRSFLCSSDYNDVYY